MGPKPPKKSPETTRNTGESPASKRPKTNSNDCASLPTENQVEGHGETIATARSLTFDDDRPPKWFMHFEAKIYTLLDTRLKEQDDKIDSVRFDLDQINSKIKKLQDENLELVNKLDDLENRSRRNNFILHGVPESDGDFENCTKVVSELLVNFVGVDEACIKSAIQRVHRTPTNKPASLMKPRIIHVAVATFQDKIKIKRACVNKFKNQSFKGNKLFISDDLSKSIQTKRKAKMEVFKRLQSEGKHPFFVFPDVIKYRNGQELVTVT